MTTWADEYIQLIDDCEHREERLTNWEINFVDSLRRQIAQDRRLTANQIEALNSTWERATERG